MERQDERCLDAAQRAAEKERSRVRDREDIRSGKASVAEVNRRNAHFSMPGIRPRLDLAKSLG